MSTLIGNSGGISLQPIVNGVSSGSATVYYVESWGLTWSNDVQDVTDTCSGANVQRIAGLNSAQLSASAFFKVPLGGDGDVPQWTAIKPGLAFDAQLNVGNSTSKATGRFITSEVKVDSSVKNPVKFEVTALSTGAVTVS